MNLGLVAVWFCGGIIHCVNPYHGLPVRGWRKMAGYDRLMLLLCQRMRLQSSLLQCLWLYIWTDVEVVLVNIPAQMELSFVVHMEIFSCSWIILIHPRNSSLFCILFLELLHSLSIVREQDEALLKCSVNGLMAESRSAWTGGEQLFWGLLPITPLIAAVV